MNTMLTSLSVYDSEFGPGDQGILNRVYESQLKSNLPLSNAFNAKPYKPFLKDASIVHFHGPKIFDYLDYVKGNGCRFDDMCEKGMRHAFCSYYREMDISVDLVKLGIFSWEDRKIMQRRCF